jgi:hypothetical protein
MTKKKKLTIQDLAQIIRDNPGCYVEVDNDWWALWVSKEAKDTADDDDEVGYLVSSSEMGTADWGYGFGNCYGGDILLALALIQGITVESV